MKALLLLSCATAGVVFALDAPVVGIHAEVEGDSVYVGLDWSPVVGATRYNVYYKPDPASPPEFLAMRAEPGFDTLLPAGWNGQNPPDGQGLFHVTAEQVWELATDFGDQQGYNGWFFGFTDGGSPFQLMTEYDDGIWFVDSGNYWTRITGSSMHPNGTNPSEEMLSALQQCVLRWISPSQGTVQCSGHVAKDGIGGNGVEWLVEHNGVLEYGHYLEGEDSLGFGFTLDFDVEPGDTIDFILDPHDGEDYFDSTSFGVTIRSQ